MYISCVSMVTALGCNADMTAAAVNAGLSQVQESRYFNKEFQPIKMATVPDGALPELTPIVVGKFPQLSSREKRLLRLCSGAFSSELLATIGKESICLMLAGPEDLFPGSVDVMGSNFMSALELQLEITLNTQASRRISVGRAGGLQAIDYAFEYMATTDAQHVLIGGVDTYQDHALLGILDAEDRILAPGVSNGFSPGEAAAFLLLSASPRSTNNEERQVRLSLPGLSQELGHLYSYEVYLGEGFNHAVQQALDNSGLNDIKSVFASMNGENFWVKEMGVAIARNQKLLHKNVSIAHPADCFGDIGAAFAAVVLGMLTLAGRGNHLVYGSSDGAVRAAICVEVA
jgi:3-oxoacyl-[acyl-carrier-protein] synthase-1